MLKLWIGTAEDWVNSSKLTCLCLPVIGLVAGCTIRQSTPSAKASESQFIAAFRQAHDHHNVEALSKLVCWDRVPSEMRKLSEDALKAFLDDKIVDIKVTTEHPQGRPADYTYVRKGINYKFNLPVVAELVVENPPLQKQASSSTDYPLAMKDGRYCIAQMAPVEGSEMQQPATPSNVLGQATQPSQTGKTSEGPQPKVVPANTVLIVRLAEDLGMKTARAGGSFSATVVQPVVVNGFNVIPVGSSIRGIVAKKGDYSPDATLTSVIVNGTSHKILTEQMIFNEDVVFPAGSQMTFVLLFPLDLKH